MHIEADIYLNYYLKFHILSGARRPTVNSEVISAVTPVDTVTYTQKTAYVTNSERGCPSQAWTPLRQKKISKPKPTSFRPLMLLLDHISCPATHDPPTLTHTPHACMQNHRAFSHRSSDQWGWHWTLTQLGTGYPHHGPPGRAGHTAGLRLGWVRSKQTQDFRAWLTAAQGHLKPIAPSQAAMRSTQTEAGDVLEVFLFLPWHVCTYTFAMSDHPGLPFTWRM